MADDPSNGELAHRLEAVHQDLKEDLRDVGRQLDKKVSSDVYALRHDALTARVKALEDLRTQDAARVAATRRWLLGAVIVPLVAVLLAYILSKGGSG